MENKQTAAEWLHSELHRQCMFDGFAWEDRNYFIKLFEQAKAMEEEQISNGYYQGLLDGMNNSPREYYKDNYVK